MPRETKRELQARSLLDALAQRPGLTAYQLCSYLVQPPPLSYRMPLALSLLGELRDAGQVRSEADEGGRRWYLAGETGKGQEALHDDDPADRHGPEDSA